MTNKLDEKEFLGVDLELPSGTIWAKCNVGAEKPSDAGLYFQWGDTIGYKSSQIGNGNGQKKFAINGSDYNKNLSTKYNTPGVTLELEDDAANKYMKGNWHMPTLTQVQELINNTTSTWTTQNNVNGRLFTSKKDPLKSIFIPAAWNAWNGSINNTNDYGSIWLCILNKQNTTSAYHFDFYSDYVIVRDASLRYNGRSVRGVIG